MPTADSFTTRDLEQACDDLSMTAFFPHEARASVMTLLRTMCPHRTALRWLVAEVVNHVGKWPGPAELRGILCTRYDPADKVDHWCTLPGYTAAEAEAKHLDQHKQLTQAEGYLQEESKAILVEAKRKVKRIS